MFCNRQHMHTIQNLSTHKKEKIKIGHHNTYTVLCRKEFYKNEK